MSSRRLSVAVVCLALNISIVSGGTPPATPGILEPDPGQITNAADTHMDGTAFFDADLQDSHFCSDWEIWTLSPIERVWAASCVEGPEKIHAHLGDGVFENTHAGRTELFHSTQYRLRLRQRDDSGEPASEWSSWSELFFETAAATEILPLELKDVSAATVPDWVDSSEADVVFEANAPPASLKLESASGELLLELRAGDGIANTVINPAALESRFAIRVVVDSGGGPVDLPKSQLTIRDSDQTLRTILLPDIQLLAGQQSCFWVASYGNTFVGELSQSSPDFTSVARGLAVPFVAREAGFEIDLIAEGLHLPLNIAFVPVPGHRMTDPFLYLTELHGKIKVMTRDGTVSNYATGLLNYVPSDNFPGSGEQGLTGIAVDPVSGDLFAAMLYDAGSSHYPKIVRLSSSDGGHTSSSQVTILDMAGESQGQSHQISQLTIGPDGRLYAHVGDGFSPATAQDLSSYRGKILRLNLDGSPAMDNPFYDAADGIDAEDYVYAYGLRNPFGGGWRASDGELYEVENGPSIDRLAKVIPGQNYLWDGINTSMENFAIHNWFPGAGPVNLTFVQTGTFGGSGFPYDQLGRVFISESGPTYAAGPQERGKRISAFTLNAAGTSLLGGPDPLLEMVGSGRATVAGMAAGPDGLYFTDLYKDLNSSGPTAAGARLWRVRWGMVPRLTLIMGAAGPSWNSHPSISEYDLIRGDLALLRSGQGDFSLATSICLANDLMMLDFDDATVPGTAGEGFWYLVRDLDGSGAGSYESGGVGQHGLRDPEIQSASGKCP